MRFVLASSSPARLGTLRRAGIAPIVQAPTVDESGVNAPTTKQLVEELARLKGHSVLASMPIVDAVVVACDSLLEFDGLPIGKPGTPEAATAIWRGIRGRQGVLWTGHHVSVIRDGTTRCIERSVNTRIWFAYLSDTEVEAYVATGEPTHVAGGFTIDGYGAAFVERIEGDPHNVVGISVPTLRVMLAELGVGWPSLWAASASSARMP